MGDLVVAFLLAADVPSARGRTYLIGDDTYVSLDELVQRVGRALDTNLRIYRFPWHTPVHLLVHLMELVSRPFGYEPPLFRRRLTWFITNRGWDISRARPELGYRPRVNLDQGLRLTRSWYAEQRLL